MKRKFEYSEVEHIAEHYNKRPEIGIYGREKSRIIRLKNYNNWVKAVLINEFARPGDHVLDLCCGKGGDFGKWSKRRIASLTGADVAEVSISQAKERYNNLKYKYPANIYAADCFTTILDPPEHLYTTVSAQFALHYSFESEEKVRTMFKNVTNYLRPNGVFFGTITNGSRIVKNIRNSKNNSFGNSLYSITFQDKENFSLFGSKYYFKLEDAIDDCPEYLVHFPTFINIAKEYGLELILQKDFHEFYNYYIQYESNIDLFKRMKVLDLNGNFSKEEWEVAGIYLAFVFRKKGDDHDTPTDSPYTSPHTSNYSSPPSSSQRQSLHQYGHRGGPSRNNHSPTSRYKPHRRPPNNNRAPLHGYGHAPPYGKGQDYRRNEKPYSYGNNDNGVPPPSKQQQQQQEEEEQ